jgi:hypothetical protein
LVCGEGVNLRTVWKYEISLETLQELQIPKGAILLSLQRQGHRKDDKLCLWCLVDTEEEKEARTFFLLGTGEELPTGIKYEYVGTIQYFSGVPMVHLFEVWKGK